MELVYLWVEEYKNIEKQGFNFSPRFECDYDEDTNKLTIDENKDYVSIFPDNINITAIVGENGSGKSTILESLQDVLSENFSKWLDEEKYRKCIVIYQYDNKYIYLVKHMNDIKIVNKQGQPIDWIDKNPNNRLLEWNSDILTLILQNEVKLKTIFKEDKQIFIEPTQITDKNKVKKYIVMNTMNSASFKDEGEKFFNPRNVSIKIKWHNLFYAEEDSRKYEEIVLKKIQTKVEEGKQKLKDKKYKDCFYIIFEICDIKRTKLEMSSLAFSLYTKANSSNYHVVNNNYNCLSKIVPNQLIKDVHKSTIDRLDEFENMIINIDKFDNNIIDFIFDLPEFIFDIDIKDNDKSFDDLSFGERQLLTQLNCILFYANKKQYIQYEGIDFFKDEERNEHEVDVDYEKKVKSMVVLLDEFEVGLHPNWQKKAINYIVAFLQGIDGIDFNLIMTSHSPFILSNLPKENVIFLENGEQKYPFKDQQTFGANIHTLLSDGFFMSDGLMGEFAKGKIEEIKKFYDFIQKFQTRINLNDKIKKRIKQYYLKRKEKFEHIQSIIGEPFLQTVIKNYLDELYLIFSDDNTLIDKELEELQKRQEYLKSLKND